MLFITSCDDISTNKQQATNQQYIASTVSGNALHDSLIATSLGTLIDDGVVIDSILFIGIDSTGSLGFVVLDDQDDEHTSVSIMNPAADDDTKTARRMCKCPDDAPGTRWPGECSVVKAVSYWSCEGAPCCRFSSEDVALTTLNTGFAALQTMSYVPSVTIMVST